MKIFETECMQVKYAHFSSQLANNLRNEFNKILGKNREVSRAKCENVLDKIFQPTKEKILNGHFNKIGGKEKLEGAIGEAEQKYRNASRQMEHGPEMEATWKAFRSKVMIINFKNFRVMHSFFSRLMNICSLQDKLV